MRREYKAESSRAPERLPRSVGSSGENGARWAIAAFGSVSPTWSGPGSWSASSRRSTPTWKRRRSSAASTRPAARPCYFARVKGCRFPMVSNLFGTIERTRFLFRDTLAGGAAPGRAEGRSGGVLEEPVALPRRAADALAPAAEVRVAAGPVLAHQTTIDQLPQLAVLAARRRARSSPCRRSTPRTPTGPAGGTPTSACIACSFPATSTSRDREVGLHYQIHRGIGVHHAAALRRGVPFRVNVFVGGPPAMTLAAVMPLPEGTAGAGVRRGAGRPARAAASPLARDGKSRSAACRPRPTSASPAPSIRTGSCPKGRSATTSATTAWPTTFRC